MMNNADTSYWQANAGPRTAHPPLNGELRVDVAIVGAGYTGLSTAYHIATDAPGQRVAVLEAADVGAGASGRNAGFSMTLFGMGPAITQALYGRQRAAEALRYTERAVDALQDLIRQQRLPCDYTHPGRLQVATSPAAVRRIQHELKMLESLGVRELRWLDAAAVRGEVDSQRFLGAAWTPRCGLLDPAKQVRALCGLARAAGASVFENSPVLEIRRAARFTLVTPTGSVTADKLVIATNAYSHRLALLRSRQAAVFTHMIATEPLSAAQRAGIGWRAGQGVEDARNLAHYLRLTADGRLLIGGGDLSLAWGSGMDKDDNPRVFEALERTMAWLFPGLRGVHVSHRWGGPVSVTADLAPVIGQLGDARAWYSLGCLGHGVALAHLNGRTLADLVLERQTELSEVWFVKRRVLPWPPEPLRCAAGQLVRAVLRLQDALHERGR